MDNLLKDYFEFMFVYIDDILIASKNMKDHIKHLEIFSDACHKEGLVLSEKKATIAVNKIEFLGILIDEGIELQEHIVEQFPDVLKDKKQLQSFLGVVNFAGIFIKDLAKYRKDFRPLLKETESAKWKWEEIHTQRVRELKQVCNNLPKLAIPQDEDELVVYTDANDYRWAAVLMKKTTTGEEPCRYTGGLFTEQQAQVWHINEKEFFAVWKAFKKWPLFLLAKEFTLKVDNTNVKAFLKNKLESKIEKAPADSSTACTRPSSDSGETATDESQGVKTSDDSSQPSTSGVKEGEISLRPMTGTSRTNTNELSSSSSSAWQQLQRWQEKGLIQRFISSSCRDQIWWLSTESKLPQKKLHWCQLLAKTIFPPEELGVYGSVSPRWTKSSIHSKSSQQGEWIVPVKLHDRKSTEFAESMFEKKRMLIWENKLPATESTRMKACNMLHVGQWHNHVCPCCEKQEKPLFGTKIRVTQKKPEPNPDKGTCEPSAAVVWLEEVRKTEDLGYPKQGGRTKAISG
ncbi:Enzymatic polyprotein [Sesamum angolense]|uniref:Enzymatic polyprotein n=1 Tax=Sesamum angolense TaxID=2727404 RepID=A0AAE1T7A8_9LAMI|nr:Enzymatic polyprotein [Sesamum angolense]